VNKLSECATLARFGGEQKEHQQMTKNALLKKLEITIDDAMRDQNVRKHRNRA
jgi:hypothetical protein